MYSNLLKLFAVFLPLMMTACLDENSNTKSKQNSTQVEFCKVLSDYRDAYLSENKKDFYIDQKTVLENIYTKRKENLESILKDGYVENWEGTISKILVSEKGAFLEVKLSCGASLEAQDNLIIDINSPLYQDLRHYSENSRIKFSGHFLVAPNKESESKYPYKTHYGEKSFTKIGSISEPEFLFEFTAFHNQ